MGPQISSHTARDACVPLSHGPPDIISHCKGCMCSRTTLCLCFCSCCLDVLLVFSLPRRIYFETYLQCYFNEGFRNVPKLQFNLEEHGFRSDPSHKIHAVLLYHCHIVNDTSTYLPILSNGVTLIMHHGVSQPICSCSVYSMTDCGSNAPWCVTTPLQLLCI